MPLYMSTFGYKPEVWAGLVKSPENREKAVSQILKEAGCELRGLWYAFGEADGFALIEAPVNTTAAGLAIAITSSGAFRKFETTSRQPSPSTPSPSAAGAGLISAPVCIPHGHQPTTC